MQASMWIIIYFFFLKQTAHKISGTMRIICTTIPRCERNKTRAVVWDMRRRVATDANIFRCVQFCTSGILSKMRVFPNSRGGTTSKRDWDRQTDRVCPEMVVSAYVRRREMDVRGGDSPSYLTATQVIIIIKRNQIYSNAAGGLGWIN